MRKPIKIKLSDKDEFLKTNAKLDSNHPLFNAKKSIFNFLLRKAFDLKDK
ncbi:hypothetical protein [Metabacillus sp. cB07]|nr:hypothetical protein [Metabacillus sp. cB07]